MSVDELTFLRQVVRRAEPLIRAYAADNEDDPDIDEACGDWLDLYGVWEMAKGDAS